MKLVDIDIEPAADRSRGQSVVSLQTPPCAVPAELELSTDEPVIEMGAAVASVP